MYFTGVQLSLLPLRVTSLCSQSFLSPCFCVSWCFMDSPDWIGFLLWLLSFDLQFWPLMASQFSYCKSLCVIIWISHWTASAGLSVCIWVLRPVSLQTWHTLVHLGKLEIQSKDWIFNSCWLTQLVLWYSRPILRKGLGLVSVSDLQVMTTTVAESLDWLVCWYNLWDRIYSALLRLQPLTWLR